ncbi:MAG: hypothetical protein ACYSU3_09820 [Planctomycetota bacterium]
MSLARHLIGSIQQALKFRDGGTGPLLGQQKLCMKEIRRAIDIRALQKLTNCRQRILVLPGTEQLLRMVQELSVFQLLCMGALSARPDGHDCCDAYGKAYDHGHGRGHDLPAVSAYKLPGLVEQAGGDGGNWLVIEVSSKILCKGLNRGITSRGFLLQCLEGDPIQVTVELTAQRACISPAVPSRLRRFGR